MEDHRRRHQARHTPKINHPRACFDIHPPLHFLCGILLHAVISDFRGNAPPY